MTVTAISASIAVTAISVVPVPAVVPGIEPRPEVVVSVVKVSVSALLVKFLVVLLAIPSVVVVIIVAHVALVMLVTSTMLRVSAMMLAVMSPEVMTGIQVGSVVVVQRQVGRVVIASVGIVMSPM